jgi:hypothetical protein
MAAPPGLSGAAHGANGTTAAGNVLALVLR